MIGTIYLHGVRSQEREVEIIRVVGDVATVRNEYAASRESRYSIASGRALKADGQPHPWDFWRLEMPTTPESEAGA